MPKILLVDDSKTTRAIIAKALRAYECEILEAPNGADALTLAESALPDFILLDVTMPVMDGIETLRRLKATDAVKEIPVMMLTANSSPEEIALITELGARDYMTKAYKADTVVDRVKQILPLELKS
ncbi:MAG: PleD family two-component system response regulator [Candidatus Methylacidiphilales bacterium]|nr:response regulator [Candidatus Methylacidiphilales bacterium]